MKKLMMVLGVIVAIAVVAPVSAQSAKQLKKELKAKADKESRKEAKEMEKAGWKVMPGKLPLEKQLQEAKYSALMENDKGGQRYLTATHQSVGGNYTAAKQIADDRARMELAQSVYNDVSGKIKNQVASTNFGDGDVTSLDEFLSANQSVITAQLQGVESVVEIYRQKNNLYEVMVFIRIDAEAALRNSRHSLYNALKGKSEALAEEVNKALE